MTENEIFNERDTSWCRLLFNSTAPHFGHCAFSNTLSDFTQKCIGFEMFPLSQMVKMVIYVKPYPCDSAILHNDKAMSIFVGLK